MSSNYSRLHNVPTASDDVVCFQHLLRSAHAGSSDPDATAVSTAMEAIIASVLNRYYCFAHPESILWIYWYVREASTAIIVTNVPHCYALPRKVFNLDAFGNLVGSMLKSKRTRNGKYGGNSAADKNKIPADGDMRKAKPGSSESTENFASHSSKPGSTLQIWQRSEYSVNANDTNDIHLENTELETIWAGGMGTTAKVEVDRSGSHGSQGSGYAGGNSGHNSGHKK
ncbi:hypothetical protein QQS21_002862 [Conoideocrella luteorostrata]|uniref:Uncharacterized protein n=1 Tax=Conoideocrella luteorostrata TaxID=1105319 RepID=A0AAJ0CVB9_9HYPO|nr:hypothetical protein QQS21_002862 [Conoideocrella luteorostrata]